MRVPPMPMELLIKVIAKAVRRMNQLLARTMGEGMKLAEKDNEITPG
jgi:hypothetical protein